MDSKLRCVFEMPNENDKLVSRKIKENWELFKLSVTLRLNFASSFDLCGCVVWLSTS